MDITRLELRKYKGYKDICLTINDKVKDGKSKQYQVKDWQRYFNWIEHTRYNWEVTEIYEQAKDKEDGRKNNKGGARNIVYADHIDYLMLEYLEKYKHINDTSKFFINKFGLRNKEYENLFYELPEIAEKLKIDAWYLWDFFAATKNIGNSIINSSLKRLDKTGYIRYEKDMIAGKSRAFGKESEHWKITDEEKVKLEEIKKWLLREMNAESEQQLISNGKYYDFKDELDVRIAKHLGIDFMYNKYLVEALPNKSLEIEDMKAELYAKYDNEDEDEIDHLEALNNKICEKIIVSVTNRHNNAVKKLNDPDCWFEGLNADSSVKYRANEEYIQIYKRLVDMFIRV